MFCSNCGQPLGAVAHLWKDQLLCEECYAKISGNALKNPSPSTIVLVSKHNDQDRTEASISSQEHPTTNDAQAIASTNQTTNTEPQNAHLLYPNEQVLWKRVLTKGIIHRNPTFTEVITNDRALVLDDTLNSIVRACPLRNSVVVVTNTRRDSSETRMGYGYAGHYGGTGMGTSHTVGDIQFC